MTITCHESWLRGPRGIPASFQMKWEGINVQESRMIDLEIRFSHMENDMEQMKKTVFEQYRIIEKLDKELQRISDRFKTFESEKLPLGPGDDKPPHY